MQVRIYGWHRVQLALKSSSCGLHGVPTYLHLVLGDLHAICSLLLPRVHVGPNAERDAFQVVKGAVQIQRRARQNRLIRVRHPRPQRNYRAITNLPRPKRLPVVLQRGVVKDEKLLRRRDTNLDVDQVFEVRNRIRGLQIVAQHEPIGWPDARARSLHGNLAVGQFASRRVCGFIEP